MLPQELFAEALWLKWRYHRVPVSIRSIHALLQRYNLKPKQTNNYQQRSVPNHRPCAQTLPHTHIQRTDR